MSNSKLHHTVCCITISLTWTVLLLILSLLYYIISKLNMLVWYQTGPDRTSYYLYLFIGCISATMVNVSPAYAMAIHQRQQLTLAEVQRGLRIALLQRDVQTLSASPMGEMAKWEEMVRKSEVSSSHAYGYRMLQEINICIIYLCTTCPFRPLHWLSRAHFSVPGSMCHLTKRQRSS